MKKNNNINIIYANNSSKYDTNVVYILRLFKNNEIKGAYIGKTIRRVSQRLCEHLNPKMSCTVSDYIRKNSIDTIIVETHFPHPWETLDETEKMAITRCNPQKGIELINKIQYKKFK